MHLQSLARILRTGVAWLLVSGSANADVVVDNEAGQPVYAETQTWSTSTGTGYRGATYRVSTSAGATATWTPNLARGQRYEVVAVFRTGTNRPSDARYTIAFDGGTSTVQVSQYAAVSSVVEMPLGRFDFAAGTGGSVRLEAVTGGMPYIADAVIFRTSVNDPPMIRPAARTPVRVMTADTVRLTAVITDDDAVTSAIVAYSTSTTPTVAWVPALDDGNHGDGAADDGMYAATIPAQSTGTTVSWSFAARDGAGQETSSPAESYPVYSEPFPEARAMWGTSWGPGFLNQAEADDWITTCRAANMNMLLPEVRKIGDAYYDSSVEPRANNITGGASYDPLGYLIQAAHDTSGGKPRLQVHAWFVMHRVWMTASGTLPAGHVLLVHPEYEMVKVDGSKDPDMLWLDPGHPGTVEHNLAVVLDCLGKYDLDGYHFDYIRYPGGATWGYNPKSVERFNTLYGRVGIPATTDTLWSDWRRECVNLEVRKIFVKAWKLKPAAILSAATFASGSYTYLENSGAYTSAYQDWARWLREGIIDYNMIMNYVVDTNPAQFQGWVNRSLAEDGGRGSIIGIGAHASTTVQGTVDQLKYCRGQAADGMNIFAWRSEVSGNLAGETRAQFYDALAGQVYPTPVDPPSPPWRASPTTGFLEGTVLSQGQPVDHASVWIEGHPETQTVSDGSGWYGILDVPVGNHTLHFSKPGLDDTLLPAAMPASGSVVTVDATMGGASGVPWWHDFN